MKWRPRVAARFRLAFSRLLCVRPGLRFLFLVGSVVVVAAIIASFLVPVTTTFTVVAETEYVKGLSAPGADLAWELQDAVVCAGPRPPIRPDQRVASSAPCDGALVSLEGVSGYLDILSSVAFEVERLADGPLRIGLRATASDPAAQVASLPFQVRLRQTRPPGSPAWLTSPVLVHFPDPQALAASGEPVALPVLAASLSFGKEAALQGVSIQPLLRHGQVTVMGTTVLGNRPYPAREVALKYGDEVSAPSSSPETLFSSLIRVDERPALQAIFRVESQKLIIRGFYSEPQVESLTFFDRVTNDSLIAGLWSLIVVGLTVLTGFAGTRHQRRGQGNG